MECTALGVPKLGGQLSSGGKDEVVQMLEANSDLFAYTVEDVGGITGEYQGVL